MRNKLLLCIALLVTLVVSLGFIPSFADEQSPSLPSEDEQLAFILQYIDILEKADTEAIANFLSEKKISADVLLNIAIAQYIKSGPNSYTAVELKEQKKLIMLALQKYTKLDTASISNIQFITKLPSVDSSLLLLENGKNLVNPDKFLSLVIKHNCEKYNATTGKFEIDQELLELQYNLVKLALDHHADPNKLLKILFSTRIDSANDAEKISVLKKLEKLALQKGGSYDHSTLISLTSYDHNLFTPEIVEMLFNNGYKNVDPNLFCQYLHVYGHSRCNQDGLSQEFLSTSKRAVAFDDPFKNFNIKPGVILKIPRIRHGIWLTNNIQKREMYQRDIENIIKAKNLFSFGEWQHIVWTNDKSLIPVSVKKLEKHGIQVREISELVNKLQLYEIVQGLIKQSRWGMASDILRYGLVYHLGGVYADVDFLFDRDIEGEIHSYDFLIHDNDTNDFFMAKPNHPVLREALDLVRRNFYQPPEYITLAKQTPSIAITYLKTVIPLHVAYAKTANINGNIDVKYPHPGNCGYSNSFNESLISLGKTALMKYVACDSDIQFSMSGGCWQNTYSAISWDDKAMSVNQNFFIGLSALGESLSWVNPEFDGDVYS